MPLSQAIRTPLAPSEFAADLANPDNSRTLQNAQIAATGEFGKGWESSDLGDRAAQLSTRANLAYREGRDRDGQVLEMQSKDLAQQAAQWAPRVQNVSDVRGLRDGVDWAAGALGNVRTSIAPAIGGLVGSGLGLVAAPFTAGIVNPVTAGFAGAALAGGSMERDEAMMGAMNDPTIRATKTMDEINNASLVKGTINSVLEAMVPTVLGGKVLTGAGIKSLVRSAMGKVGTEAERVLEAQVEAGVRKAIVDGGLKEAAKTVAKEQLKEGVGEFATEGAQSLVGQATQNSLLNKPLSDLDYKQALNEGAAGAVAGHAMGTVGGVSEVGHAYAGQGAQKVADIKADPVGTLADGVADGMGALGTLGAKALSGYERMTSAPHRAFDSLVSPNVSPSVVDALAMQWANHVLVDTKGKGSTPQEIADAKEFILNSSKGDNRAGQIYRDKLSIDHHEGKAAAGDMAIANEAGAPKKSLMQGTLVDDFGEQEGRDPSDDRVTDDFGSVARTPGVSSFDAQSQAEDSQVGQPVIPRQGLSTKGASLPQLESTADIWRKQGVDDKLLTATSDKTDAAQRQMAIGLLGWMSRGFKDADGNVFVPESLTNRYGAKAPKMIQSLAKTAFEHGVIGHAEAAMTPQIMNLATDQHLNATSVNDSVIAAIPEYARYMYKPYVEDIKGMLRHAVANGTNKKQEEALLTVFGTKGAIAQAMSKMSEAQSPYGNKVETIAGEPISDEHGQVVNDYESGLSETPPQRVTYQGYGKQNLAFNMLKDSHKANHDTLLSTLKNQPGVFATSIGAHDMLKEQFGSDHTYLREAENKLMEDAAKLSGRNADPRERLGAFNPEQVLSPTKREQVLAKLNKAHKLVRVEHVAGNEVADQVRPDQVESFREKRGERSTAVTPSAGVLFLERKAITDKESGEQTGADEAFLTSTHRLIQHARDAEKRESDGRTNGQAGKGTKGEYEAMLRGLAALTQSDGTFTGRVGFRMTPSDRVRWIKKGSPFPQELKLMTGTVADAEKQASTELRVGQPANFDLAEVTSVDEMRSELERLLTANISYPMKLEIEAALNGPKMKTAFEGPGRKRDMKKGFREPAERTQAQKDAAVEELYDRLNASWNSEPSELGANVKEATEDAPATDKNKTPTEHAGEKPMYRDSDGARLGLGTDASGYEGHAAKSEAAGKSADGPQPTVKRTEKSMIDFTATPAMLGVAASQGPGLAEGTTIRKHIINVGGVKVGHVSLEKKSDGTVTGIYSLVVAPGAQNSGIGTQIVQRILNKQTQDITLYGVRDEARKFWKSFGAEFEGPNVKGILRHAARGTGKTERADSRANASPGGNTGGLPSVNSGAGRSEKAVNESSGQGRQLEGVGHRSRSGTGATGGGGVDVGGSAHRPGSSDNGSRVDTEARDGRQSFAAAGRGGRSEGQEKSLSSTQLDDAVLNEKYDALNTVAKLQQFAQHVSARARELESREEAGETLSARDEGVSSIAGQLAYDAKKSLKNPDTFTGTDFESFFDGIEHTEADVTAFTKALAGVGVKYSTQAADLGTNKRATKEEVAAAKQHILDTLGGSVKLIFVKHFGDNSSGSWTPGATTNVIRLALNGDVLGTAYHESMHEFFCQLGKAGNSATKAMLRRVAMNPLINRRIERLLADHPEAAAQVRSDPDEAAAFMYQFWRAGVLKLGPETQTFFEKIKAFFAKITGQVSAVALDAQHAETIMAAFSAGALKEDSTRETMLKSMNESSEAHEKALETLDKAGRDFTRTVGKLLFSAEAMLKGTKNQDMISIANDFHQEAGEAMGEKQGLLEATKQHMAIWTNRLENILAAHDEKTGKLLYTPEDLELARKALSTGVPTKDRVAKELVEKITKFNEDMFKYITSRGVSRWDDEANKWVPVEHRADYFRRVWDTDAVRDNAEGFHSLLLKHHMKELTSIAKQANGEVANNTTVDPEFASSKEMKKAAADRQTITPEMVADAIVSRLLNANGQVELQESTSSIGMSPVAASVNRRSLSWIDAKVFDDFLSKDLTNIMSGYVSSMVKRAEHTRVFGNGAEKMKAKVDRAILREMGGSNLVLDAEEALPSTIKSWKSAKAAWVEAGNAAKDFEPPFPTLRSVGQGIHFGRTGQEQGMKDLVKATKALEQGMKAIMAMEGTLGADISPALRRANSAMATYQTFRLLPLVLFSSINDVMGIVANGGELSDAWNALVAGIKEIKMSWGDKKSQGYAAKRAEEWGTVEATTRMENIGQIYGSMYMTNKARKLSNSFYKWVGMEGFNRGVRIAATTVAEHAIKADKTEGLDLSDPAAVARFETLFGKNFDPSAIALDANGELDINDTKNQAAVMRWVSNAVMSPNAAHRTIWGSDTRMASLWMLKQFAYTFHRVMLKNALAQAHLGNYRPAMVLAVGYAPVAIAADAVKEMLVPGDDPAWMKMGLGGYLRHGVDRAGIFGVPGMIYDSVSYDYGAGLLGPTLSQVAHVPFDSVAKSSVGALPFGGRLSKLVDD